MTTEDRTHDDPTRDAGDRMTDEERADGGAGTTVTHPAERERPDIPEAPAVDLDADAEAEAEAETDATSTADLARAGSASDDEARGSAAWADTDDDLVDGDGERAALFAEADASDYRDRWQQVQTEFVDDPRQAVQRADALVAELMKRLAETFAAERSELEGQWDRGGKVSTEDLRVALQRYRSFFDRLLSL
jgi:hypothetical protein